MTPGLTPWASLKLNDTRRWRWNRHIRLWMRADTKVRPSPVSLTLTLSQRERGFNAMGVILSGQKSWAGLITPLALGICAANQ